MGLYLKWVIIHSIEAGTVQEASVAPDSSSKVVGLRPSGLHRFFECTIDTRADGARFIIVNNYQNGVLS